MALIEFEHTPNPDALRVQTGQMFTNGPARDFDRSNCGDYPLVHALLAIDGIVRVMLGRDFVTVVRSGPDIGWEALRPEIALALLERAIAHPRRRFRSGKLRSAKLSSTSNKCSTATSGTCWRRTGEKRCSSGSIQRKVPHGSGWEARAEVVRRARRRSSER